MSVAVPALVEPAAAVAAAPGLVAHPSSLVKPLDGTGTGPVSPGSVSEFPGADTPFGMMQWSPDTSPDLVQSGGGYSYADSTINGFSLTHLSGSGCAAYGDVPVLPTVGAIGSDPATTIAPFSHASEHAAPGRYAVTLGASPVRTELAVTARSGIASFAFPSTGSANLLFKVGDSANPVTAARVSVVGTHELTGQVTSGGFCGTGTPSTLSFVAQFDRPFTVAGTWTGATVTAGATSCSGPGCGAYVTFDARRDQGVLAKIGISFVSVADAAQNLASEDPGWSLGSVEAAATARWDRLLGRIRIGGGSPSTEHIFYTALYHSLLFPSVVSDVNGRYPGADGRIHRVTNRQEYANFSEWDIYRSEIQLLSVLAPHQTGDMVQTLVDDAAQTGWLPKWAIVGGDAGQMNGDSADPIIASAYAFGVRNFDVRAALAAMVKGADRAETGHGLLIERQYLDQYLSQHYVNAASPDITSIDYTIGGSATLEYAIDDFAIGQLAEAEGDRPLAASMSLRAHNWEYLFNPATGSLQARTADGSFPAGPAFNPALLEAGGQQGFEEGNAAQYTWAVPQDLAALAALKGGNASAVATLDAFFSQLNVGRFAPYDWAGNEPGLWTPFEYDAFGAPARTQEVVRQIEQTLYADAPVDEPGNDDLGAISSWYVWAALGFYPLTPGTGDLALASPLFPEADVTLPDGNHLVIDAPAAAPSRPFVHAMTVHAPGVSEAPRSCTSGRSPARTVTWDQPWLPGSVLRSGGTVAVSLSSVPDPTWGSDPGRAPPAFATGRLPAVGYSQPSGSTTEALGRPVALEVGIRPASVATLTVEWTASGAGLTVTPSSGTFTTVSPGAGSCAAAPSASRLLTVTGLTGGLHPLEVRLRTAGGQSLPPVVVDVQVAG